MKVTITIESNGPTGVKIKCDPPIHKLKKMAQGGVGGPVLGITGLALKRLFESCPAGTVQMPNDDQAFTHTNAQVAQAARHEAASSIAKDVSSKLLLPGRDF